MWLRRPLMTALAKRAAVVRMPAVKTTARMQSAPTKAVVQCMQPRRSFTFKASRSRNVPRVVALRRLVGTGMALGALCAAASCEGSKDKAEKPAVQYQAPFEESRKKFYKDLESKPWGEVSKKYIRALQEEEQKLMDEFFEITKLSKDEWNRTLIEKQQAINLTVNGDAKKMENAKDPISQSLKLGLDAAANACGLDHNELRYGYSEEISHDVMGAYGNLVYINKNADFGNEIDCDTQQTMRHEMQHILHSDSCIRESIGAYCKEGGAFYCRWSRFKEKRADILALLSIHPDCHPARNNYAYVLLMQLPKSISTDTHPSWSERASYSRQLHKEMEEAIAKNK